MDKETKDKLIALSTLYLLLATAEKESLSIKAAEIFIKIKEWNPNINQDDLLSIINKADKLITDKDHSKLAISYGNLINNTLDEDNKINVLRDLIDLALIDGKLNKPELIIIEFLANTWGLFDRIDIDEYVQKVKEKDKRIDDVKNQNIVEEDEEIECYNESTSPEYPGEFYFDTPEYLKKDIVFNDFPKVENVELLFTKFKKDEVKAIARKIEEERIIPYLSFVNEILMTGFQKDSKIETETPFWFIPFGFFSENTGCSLIFNQDGIYGNLDIPIRFQILVSSNNIKKIKIYHGFDENNLSYEDSIKTIKIEHSKGNLTFTEFFGKEYGSQLEIVYAIWKLWSEVIEFNQDSSSFSLNIPDGPEFKNFICWDELVDWAQEFTSVEEQNEIDEIVLPDEIIVEVIKMGNNYKALAKDTEFDFTGIIDNSAKLKYAFERSGLIRGKKNKNGLYEWRVINKN